MNGFDSLTMKPGDEVMLYYGFRGLRLARIERITPSGIVIIEGWGPTFDRHGEQRGRADPLNRGSLAVATPQLRELAARKRLHEEIKSVIRESYLSDTHTSQRLELILQLLSEADDPDCPWKDE